MMSVRFGSCKEPAARLWSERQEEAKNMEGSGGSIFRLHVHVPESMEVSQRVALVALTENTIVEFICDVLWHLDFLINTHQYFNKSVL